MSAPKIDISAARKHLNSMDERLKHDRVVVVTRHNRSAFALVDLDTLSSVVKTLETLANPAAMRSLRASVAALPTPL
jgi:PHD/YefM family antitoxin component YafN of YafNO toxin-antitoxin module